MLRQYGKTSPVVPESCFVATSTEIIGNVILGENVGIWYGTVIRGDINRIEIGDNTNIQDASVLHVDLGGEDPDTGALLIGKNVTVGHRALLHACRIGDNCLIGMGAIILSGAVIGSGSIIAAGAVVKENDNIPPGSLVVGLPAKIKGQVTAEWHERIKISAQRYVELAQRHKQKVS
jgi:carbonic anhydrase/acetyltransferase-like protein (isoleucine patch superfamily)